MGPTLGAKLIRYTGGLGRLTVVPSGTIQLLGAEKALFRHLKEKADPPKYGVIFQHPMINQAKWWHRGKIARTFASKISIAARIDYYGGEFIADTLEKQMEKRVAEVKKKYPNPPAKNKKKAEKWHGGKNKKYRKSRNDSRR
jgi:nucleolar protein 56